jgi:hypothetical protein
VIRRVLALAGVLAALGVLLAGATTANAQQPGPTAVGPFCPPASETVQGVDVCVDRGDGSTYRVGDPITICVTANIPQIAIFPPPPPPTVRLVSSTNGGPELVLFEGAFASGQRCFTYQIVPPTGTELMRVDVIDQNGRVFDSDVVTFFSVG